MKESYILGLDPGLSEVGFGIIKKEGSNISYVDAGIIKTTPKHTFWERLSIIKKDMEALLKLYSYAAVGIEELFFVKNVTNGIKVAHARGVMIETVHHYRFPIYELKPLEVKNNVCGYGGADKRQMQEMVKKLLRLNSLPRPYDAADALGIALCVGQMLNSKGKILS